jgi:hypothetical protein
VGRLNLPFLPVQMRGGKKEEWMVYLGGQPLIGRHPTFADKNSALLYVDLLQEEVQHGTFALAG